MFLKGLEESSNRNCLGHRPQPEAPYTFISYTEAWRRAENIASAIVGHLGIKPGNHDFSRFNLNLGNKTLIGIYAQNCPEWTISCLAAIRQSIITVPLYDTLGADAAQYIVEQTEME